MDRRDFFVRGAIGLGALAIPGCAQQNGRAVAAPARAGGVGSWPEVRALFPLAPDRVHMTGFLLASHPKPVADAIEAHRRGFDEDPVTYLHEHEALAEKATRAAAARYLGGEADDVAMTDSTTMGLGIVYGGLVLRDKQEILTTTHDHIVTHVALEQRAARSTTPIRKVSLYDDPSRTSADEIIGRFEKAITPATRVIAVTWVHSGTGVKLPIRELSAVVARANTNRADADRAVLFVDGVHGFGNQAERAADLGCDFFIAGCHKWLLGPRGTGVAWARRAAWSITSPTIPTFDPSWRPEPLDQIPPAAWMSPGGFHSFEHRWALAQAFELHEQIGREKIAMRIAELNTRCKEGLAGIAKVKMVTPREVKLSAGIICFNVDGKAPQQVVKELFARKIVASVTPDFYEPTYVRLAPSLTTLEGDVDRAVAAVAAVAG
jgi:selenocysteine lyase/cysteine desulfurase